MDNNTERQAATRLVRLNLRIHFKYTLSASYLSLAILALYHTAFITYSSYSRTALSSSLSSSPRISSSLPSSPRTSSDCFPPRHHVHTAATTDMAIA